MKLPLKSSFVKLRMRLTIELEGWVELKLTNVESEREYVIEVNVSKEQGP